MKLSARQIRTLRKDARSERDANRVLSRFLKKKDSAKKAKKKNPIMKNDFLVKFLNASKIIKRPSNFEAKRIQVPPPDFLKQYIPAAADYSVDRQGKLTALHFCRDTTSDKFIHEDKLITLLTRLKSVKRLNLKKFDFGNNINLTRETMKFLVDNCPQLEELAFSGTHRTSFDIEGFDKLPIKTLYLGIFYNLLRSEATLLEQMPSLKRIYVDPIDEFDYRFGVGFSNQIMVRKWLEQKQLTDIQELAPSHYQAAA